MKFIGRVIKARFAAGTKSERDAVFLETGGRRLLLRKAGGNAFEPDEEFLKWLGEFVEVDGTEHKETLLVKNLAARPEII